MGIGAFINNAVGGRLIDADAPNLMLKEKRSVTTVLHQIAGSSPYGSAAALTVEGEHPVVFWQADFPVCILRAYQSGRSWTYGLWCDAPIGSVIQVLIFDDAHEVSVPGAYGIETYNASARRTWALRGKPLIVRGFGGNDELPANLPAGRSYAMGSVRGCLRWVYYERRATIYLWSSYMNGAQPIIRDPIYQTGTSPPGQDYGQGSWPLPIWAIADVTGY